MLDINGMKIKITKSHFNRAKIQEDGITHIIDSSIQYPMYSLDICKNYYDVDDKEIVVDYLIKDLKLLIVELEKYKEKIMTKN